MSTRPPSPRRLRAAVAGVVVALALLPWLAVASARAATLEVPQGAGLTQPGGLAETPKGALWAAEAVSAVRRLKPLDRLGAKRPARPSAVACEAR